MNIIDKKNALKNFEREILEQCAKAHFRLGEFSCIDDILDALGLDVVIEDGEPDNPVPPYLEEAHEYWKNVCSSLESESDSEGYRIAQRNLELVCNEIRSWPEEQRAPGVYDHESRVIRLYPRAIWHSYTSGTVTVVLMGSLVREVLHAYFMRPGHEDCPYNYFIEEPLAEFGVLLYIWHVSGRGRAYEWMRGRIRRKRTVHGLAVNLMDQYFKTGERDSYVVKYLEEYRLCVGKFMMPGYDAENQAVILPYMHGENVPFIIDGRAVRWNKAVNKIPRYFWDEMSRTLGLDGEWVCKRLVEVPEVKVWIDMGVDMHGKLGEYSGATSGYSLSPNFITDMYGKVNIYLGQDFRVICEEEEEKVWIETLKKLEGVGIVKISPLNEYLGER